MKLKELVEKNRSCRRFRNDGPLDRDFLESLVSLARLIPSAANRQPLKYFLSSDESTNDAIFPTLSWAAYLTDWLGPEPHERPQGYIVICGDTNITRNVLWDHGIAAQTIMLGAVEAGYAGCIIGAVNKDELQVRLSLPDHLDVLLVCALGRPGEEVFIENIDIQSDAKYWRDEKGHHVPKRSLQEILINSNHD